MPRRRRAAGFAVALVVALSVFVFADGPAHACSCVLGDPRDALHAADAAFVGALQTKDDLGDGTTVYTFSVRRSVKGSLSASVDVESATSGATCGFEVKVGERIGILLHRQRDGGWSGGLCTQIDPEVLIAAGRPLPRPDGEGPIRLIVGGNFGEARVLALDGVGRTLGYGYGYGDGAVLSVSMCPGMTRFAESVAFRRTGSLVVRDTATLEVVREVPLIAGRFPSIYEVACLSDDGELLAAVDTRRGVSSVHVLRGAHDRIAFSGDHAQAWFQGARAYVKSGNIVARLGLWSGSLEPVAQVPRGLGSIAVSDDQRHVGGVLYGDSRRGSPPSQVVTVRSVDGAVDAFALRGSNDSGDVHWLDDRHLVYLPGGADDDRAHVLSLPGLARVGGFRGWYTGTSFLVHGCARGVGWGTLFSACLPDGPVRTRDLLGPETFTVAPVAGSITPSPRLAN